MLIAQLIFTILALKISQTTYTYDEMINFHWKGNFTSDSIQLKVFPNMEYFLWPRNLTFSLLLFERSETDFILTKDQFTSLLVLKPVANVTYPTVFALENLKPNSSYSYFFYFHKNLPLPAEELRQALQNDIIDYYNKAIRMSDRLFKLTTPGRDFSPYSFKFGVASCARSGSESLVFQEIYDLHPDILFFLHTGDLHYLDIDVDDLSLFEKAYNLVFSSRTQRYLFERVPIEYIWDDHDFGQNDADGTSKSRSAATLSYYRFVPHRDLRNTKTLLNASSFPQIAPELKQRSPKKPSADAVEYGIYRSFAVGRVFFIIMDLRSYRNFEDERSMLGDDQYRWLQSQFFYVSENSEKFKQVMLISSVPWIGEGIDWSEYNEVRIEIANLINDSLLQKGIELLMISGDAHMLSFDTGRNNKYGAFPVLNSASLDQTGSCKGGPFTHGPFPGKDDYSIVAVHDEADKFCVEITAIRKGRTLIEYNTCDKKEVESKLKKNNVCPVNFKTQLIIACSAISGLVAFMLSVYLLVIRCTKKSFDPPRPILMLPIPSNVNESFEEKVDEHSGSYARKEVLYTDMIDPKKNKTFQMSANNNDSQETYLDETKKNTKDDANSEGRIKYSRFSERKGE